MQHLSPAGICVMSEMSGSGQRPRVLRDAVRAGRVPGGGLPELIAFAWTRDDELISDISEADWLEIFRHFGFFSCPPISGGRPARAVTLCRGTTADRLRRLSWAAERPVAELLGRRRARYGVAAIYRATVLPSAPETEPTVYRPVVNRSYLHAPEQSRLPGAQVGHDQLPLPHPVIVSRPTGQHGCPPVRGGR